MRRAIAGSVLGLAAFLLFAEAARAAVVVQVRADRDEPVYRCGETATFTISVSEDGKPVTEGYVTALLSVDGICEGGASTY